MPMPLTPSTGKKRQDQIERLEQQIQYLNQENTWLRSYSDVWQASQPLIAYNEKYPSAPSTCIADPSDLFGEHGVFVHLS